jgi:hypothetical protein
MDVHKATISVAVADGGRGKEVRHLGNFLNRADHAMPQKESLQVLTRLAQTLAAQRRNHGHAVNNPRMRACPTIVFQLRPSH